MNLTYRILPALLLASCIPSMPGAWTGSSPPPLPPPPPPAASAFDTEAAPLPDGDPPHAAATGEPRVRTSESRTESHTINGREMRGGGRAANVDRPLPSQRQMKDLLRALDQIPRGDRAEQLGALIDPHYLTVDQLAALVDEIPKGDRIAAIDVAMCSVVDPENASRLVGAVPTGERGRVLSVMSQKCFRKNRWDDRPPGKMAARAAPPPGAYLLPSER